MQASDLPPIAPFAGIGAAPARTRHWPALMGILLLR
jgi:hypothetical protein